MPTLNTDFLTGFLKKKNNRILYIIFIIGIVLMLFTGKSQPKKTEETPQSYSEADELERIISKIEGVSHAEVMVTYYGSKTSNIVYDTRMRGSESDKSAVIADGKAVTAGESYPRVKGVVVVAKSDKSSAEKIRTAVCTALGISQYKVAVITN